MRLRAAAIHVVALGSVSMWLSGCMAFVGPSDRDAGVRDLVSARALWNTTGVSDYEVVVRNECFCVGAGEPRRYTVRGNVVTNVVNVRTGQVDSLATATQAGPPIEVAFDLLDRAVRDGAARLDVDYDNEWGFPRSVSVDFRTEVADDEFTLHLESFKPLSR